jgi:hypothetical protein
MTGSDASAGFAPRGTKARGQAFWLPFRVAHAVHLQTA